MLEAPQLVASAVVTNVQCFNDTNGSIVVTVTGGTPGYHYGWSNLDTTSSITGLSGGNYGVTVTDAHNCTTSLAETIISPPALTANTVVTNPLCFGDSNGHITLIVSGGTPQYTYSWSNGFTTGNLSNVPVGPYTVTITDSKLCTLVDSTQVNGPQALYTSGVIKNITCFGETDGAVNITAYGGTLPYGYSWSNGSTTQNINNVPGNNYYVTVTDGNGCSVVSLYIVVEPPLLTATMATGNVSCFGALTGNAAVIPAGGVVPYTYLWNNFVTDSFVTGVGAGEYTVQLRDSNGCFIYDSTLITQPTAINVAGTVNNVVCYNAATGSVILNVSGGTPGYTYMWSDNSTGAKDSLITAGTYNVTVSDANSCSVTSTFNVQQGTQIFANLGTYNPICYGGTTGAITAQITGGVQPYAYAWSNGDTTLSAGGLSAGNYQLTATDKLGCTVTGATTLVQPDSIAVVSTATGSHCINTASGSVISTVTGGTAPYTYLLNGTAQANDTFTHLAPGDYMIIVTDVNGCQGKDTFSVSAASQLSVTLTTADQYILTGMTTELVATATSTAPVTNYFWSPDSLFSFVNCSDSLDCNNPLAAPQVTTTLSVTVENADSCYASDTITIYVSDVPVSFVPSAFTPNGDGLNDHFTFDILGANSVEVSIFDRWGQRVYYNPAQVNGVANQQGWDGTSGGHNAPEGTYVYQFKVTYFDGHVKDMAGTVVIMR